MGAEYTAPFSVFGETYERDDRAGKRHYEQNQKPLRRKEQKRSEYERREQQRRNTAVIQVWRPSPSYPCASSAEIYAEKHALSPADILCIILFSPIQYEYDLLKNIFYFFRNSY